LPPNWDLELSYDGGTTWVLLEDWVDCWVDLGTPEGRGYFESPVSDPGPFILRVYDSGGLYLDNIGGVEFSMWVSSASADPGEVWDDNPTYYDPSQWGAGCYAKCPAPGLLQIGEWVEYARCRLVRWLAWCPEHALAIREAREAFEDVEPFKTMLELIDLTRLMREEVNSMEWIDDGGGTGDGVAEIQPPPNYILVPADGGGADLDPSYLTGDDTIWGTGEIDLTPDNGEAYTFKTECDLELKEVLGTRIAPALCFGVNVLDQLGLRWWFQMLWDGFVFIAFLMYLKKSWIAKVQ